MSKSLIVCRSLITVMNACISAVNPMLKVALRCPNRYSGLEASLKPYQEHLKLGNRLDPWYNTSSNQRSLAEIITLRFIECFDQ